MEEGEAVREADQAEARMAEAAVVDGNRSRHAAYVAACAYAARSEREVYSVSSQNQDKQACIVVKKKRILFFLFNKRGYRE